MTTTTTPTASDVSLLSPAPDRPAHYWVDWISSDQTGSMVGCAEAWLPAGQNRHGWIEPIERAVAAATGLASVVIRGLARFETPDRYYPDLADTLVSAEYLGTADRTVTFAKEDNR